METYTTIMNQKVNNIRISFLPQIDAYIQSNPNQILKGFGSFAFGGFLFCFVFWRT